MAAAEFIFETAGMQFIPALQQLLQFVQQQVALMPVQKEQVPFEAKVIFTELLTNAIKHSNTDAVYIKIAVAPSGLTIIKTDRGTPMQLLQHPQLARVGDTLQLSNDVMHILLATLTAQYTLQFSVIEQALDASPDIESLHDHFGLLLMAKIADVSLYQYDVEKQENKFIIEKHFL